MSKLKNAKNVTVVSSHKKANIAVIIVVSIAVLILIAIAVLCSVRVKPMRGLSKPNYYNLYNIDATNPEPTNSESQSRISVAMDSMSFNVMSAILQWHWDYSYNFKRDKDGKKVELSASETAAVRSSTTEFMVELVYTPIVMRGDAFDYSTAQSLEVDGETVYFDRVKVLIGNTNGKVGTISIYPFIHARLDNESDVDGIASDTYTTTGINVRANTSAAYSALTDLVTDIKRG